MEDSVRRTNRTKQSANLKDRRCAEAHHAAQGRVAATSSLSCRSRSWTGVLAIIAHERPVVMNRDRINRALDRRRGLCQAAGTLRAEPRRQVAPSIHRLQLHRQPSSLLRRRLYVRWPVRATMEGNLERIAKVVQVGGLPQVSRRLRFGKAGMYAARSPARSSNARRRAHRTGVDPQAAPGPPWIPSILCRQDDCLGAARPVDRFCLQSRPTEMDAADGLHRRAAAERARPGKELLPDHRDAGWRRRRPAPGLALRPGACAFSRHTRRLDRALHLCLSKLARNFAAYGFVLSGYTVAIVGIPGALDPGNAFFIAQARVTEISLRHHDDRRDQPISSCRCRSLSPCGGPLHPAEPSLPTPQ